MICLSADGWGTLFLLVVMYDLWGMGSGMDRGYIEHIWCPVSLSIMGVEWGVGVGECV